MTDYYDPTGVPGTSTSAASEEIRDEFTAIQAGLSNKLPALVADEVWKVNSGGTAVEGVATLAVAQGGTGAATLTDGGVLLGSGTSAVTAMAVLSDGEMIVGDGTTDPVAESGATLRTSIGVGTGNNVQFTNVVATGTLAVTGVTTVGTITASGLTTTATLSVTGAATLGGISTFSNDVRSNNAAGASILNETAASTNPVLIPNRGDTNTGWGGNGSGEIYGVVTGALGLKIDSSGIHPEGFNFSSTTISITAEPGGIQGDQALTTEVNAISVCAATNDSVTLPEAAAGKHCYISNRGAETLQIFPALNDNIDNGAVDASKTLVAGAKVHYYAINAVSWESV